MANDLSIAWDPDELFDIVSAEGVPTGISKPRAAVHRDGDWHRAVHVWIAGKDIHGDFLTFQRRSAAKDTWPGRLDATVGGHYRAGEDLSEALREVEEEIGVRVAPRDLRFVGKRISVNESVAGLRDRELQDVFLLRDDRDLTEFAPNPAELDGLVRVRLPGLLDLLAGDRDAYSGMWFARGEAFARELPIRRDDFIIQEDRYFYRVAIAAGRFLAGERHIAV